VILFCPRCGAELGTEFKGEWWSTKTPCRACGVVLAEPPPALAPSGKETEYVLEAWPAADRSVITAALVEDDFPYRWLAGLVLVVPEAAEDLVNGVLGDLSDGPVILEVEERVAGADKSDFAESDHLAVGVDDVDPVAAIDAAEVVAATDRADSDDPDPDPDDADADDADDADEGDGGEEAHAAMESLFVVADRLQHNPADATVVYDLVEASEAVSALRPPYGMERVVWRRIQELAANAADSGLDQADDEKVATAARAVRDFLRAYV